MLRSLLFAASLCFACATFGQSLPEDQNQYSIVIVDNAPATSAGAKLVKSLDTDPALHEIASRCHRHVFNVSSPLYQQRYASTIQATTLPVLALVRGDGGVLYKASGSAIPSNAELAKELSRRAIVDRSLERNAGVEFQSSSCDPNGPPCDPSQNFLRPFDHVVPDSITIRPSFDGSSVVGVLTAIFVVIVIGGVLLAAAAVIVFVLLRQ